MLAAHERIVDLFSGGGGASKGIELALGRSPNVAINHDAEAVCMHEANHPSTVHLCGDVWEYDPRAVVDGPVGLLWASPDCKHFSKAKGGAVVRSKKIRSLAWIVVKYAKLVGPRVIALENVEEFQTWGPLDDEGRPDPEKKGITFRRFVSELRACGYEVEWRELRACDYGAPTTRKRLFLIARRDGQPIVWPAKTHGPGLLPYKTAADCIDWSIPVPSIFGRTKPLAENTLRRIARGIQRFVLGSGKPFVVPLTHHGDSRVHDIDEPLPTITAAHRGELALVAPTLIQTGYGERVPETRRRARASHRPRQRCQAAPADQENESVRPPKHYGGNETPGSPMTKPFDTVTCTDHHALVTVEVGAFLTKFYGTSTGQGVDAPLDTITTHDRFGLVTVEGVDYEITDIGMRMLQPRELFRAQGFPDSYIIDPLFNGKPMTKTAQTRMCGNSVSPPMAEAIIRANLGERMAVAA
jgi:DNA (cytosine-5)-methyltransferase 1